MFSYGAYPSGTPWLYTYVCREDYLMSYHGKLLATVILMLASTYGQCATHPLVPRFAYVANNQDDTVSIFAIKKAGLRSVGYVYTGAGSNPRSVVVTPSQTFLYVAEG